MMYATEQLEPVGRPEAPLLSACTDDQTPQRPAQSAYNMIHLSDSRVSEQRFTLHSTDYKILLGWILFFKAITCALLALMTTRNLAQGPTCSHLTP